MLYSAPLLQMLAALLVLVSAAATPTATRPVTGNDNQHAAGRRNGSVLAINLTANTGQWHPNGAGTGSIST